MTLVLGDLHLLTDPEVLDGLDYVPRNAGSGLRLVASARMDPLLPLRRYRLAGELTEIRASLQMPASLSAPGPLAQPLRVGSGFIRAGFHTTGQGLGEHERGGGLEFAAEQVGGAGRLESEGPPVLATRADLGELHLALRLLARPRGARRGLPAGQ